MFRKIWILRLEVSSFWSLSKSAFILVLRSLKGTLLMMIYFSCLRCFICPILFFVEIFRMFQIVSSPKCLLIRKMLALLLTTSYTLQTKASILNGSIFSNVFRLLSITFCRPLDKEVMEKLMKLICLKKRSRAFHRHNALSSVWL